MSVAEIKSLDRLTQEVAGTAKQGRAAKGVLFRRLAQDFARLSFYLDTIREGAEKQGHKTACAAGCSWCCYQNVGVSPLEAFYLAESVEFSPEAEKLKEKIFETAERIRGLHSGERFARRIPCPILDSETGMCGAYETRPFICRSFHSLAVSACKKAFRKGDMNVPIGNLRPLFMTGYIARQGYVQGLDQTGVAGEQVELTGALAVIFRTENAYERWSAGEDIFAEIHARRS